MGVALGIWLISLVFAVTDSGYTQDSTGIVRRHLGFLHRSGLLLTHRFDVFARTYFATNQTTALLDHGSVDIQKRADFRGLVL